MLSLLFFALVLRVQPLLKGRDPRPLSQEVSRKELLVDHAEMELHCGTRAGVLKIYVNMAIAAGSLVSAIFYQRSQVTMKVNRHLL